MSSSSSDTENDSYQSDDSDWNYIPGPYKIAKSSETNKNSTEAKSSSAADEQDIGPYANDQLPSKIGSQITVKKGKHTTNVLRNYNEDLMVWKNWINGKYITLILLRDLGFRDLSASTNTSLLKVQTLIFQV